ncbi:MAG: PKD domain-containing protein [Bacteroidia bacterium]
MFPCNSHAQFQLNGSAVSLGGTCYELTPDANTQGGSIWYSQKFDLNKPFDIQFSMNLGCKSYSTGADGIGFLFQPLSTNAGSAGGGMGMGGITPSFGIEFDTYQNGWDPGFCHVAMEKNGDVNHTVAADLLAGPVQLSPTGASIPDCNSHPARITWNPVTKTVDVYFDCSLRLSYTGDIINTIFGGNSFVYWGFTAGTGGASNVQSVCIQTTYLNNLRDTAICKGASVPLTATGGLGYAWTPAAGLSSTTTASTTATPLSTTKYYVTITDSCGFQTKDSSLITVRAVKDSITNITNVLCNGASTGSATATLNGGTLPYTYSWSSGAGTPTAGTLAANTYTVQITDTYGCSDITTALITQPPALTLSVSGIAASCKGLCDGQLICIPSGGISPYTYSWSTGCTAPGCNSVCAGTYSLVVTDQNACTANTNTTVAEPATAVSLALYARTAHCNQADGNDSVIASGGTPGYTYTWSPGTGSVTQGYHNLAPGMYTVSVEDSHHCKVIDSLKVPNVPGLIASIPVTVPESCFGGSNGSATATSTGAVGQSTYSWSPSGGVAATASNLAAGTYTCYITDSAGCKDHASALIIQPTAVTAVQMPAASICISQSIALTAAGSGGTPAYTYSWTDAAGTVTSPVSPVSTTIYTVLCTDNNGCTAALQTVQITVKSPLTAVATGTASICPGASAPLGCSASGGDGVYSYTWSPAGGLSSTVIPAPVASPSVTTVYTVIVTDNCNTPADTQRVTVTLYPTPVPVFRSLDTAGCAPLCVNFQNTSSPACSNASWTFGDGATGTGCDSAKHCYTTAGTFSCQVKVKDIHGCTGSTTLNNYIHVFPLPHASFTSGPQPTTILTPDITFTDNSTGSVSRTWNFGDKPGYADTSLSSLHTYPDTGCYKVTLCVKSDKGCVDTSRAEICIDPFFTFYAPNAFTPNGDGRNETWMPQGIGLDPKFYDLSVYDRWGMRVFHTNTWGKGWDGKANNGSDIAQEDVYVWVAVLKDFKENRYNYRGIIHLVK